MSESKHSGVRQVRGAYYKGEAVSYLTHYYCAHCAAWFRHELFDPEKQALCPQCGLRVRTTPRAKNRSNYKRLYVDE